ncbi:MAG: glycoside hydrolase family 3 C-terminal domain-containing protein [Lachnospiraceae bacterium]|nr:glycoside hydrolase family 3 C-terminal domain-containing protein [Lachnospiraceae bacterium]
MSIKQQARDLVSKMTLEEKIDMLSGSSLFAMNGNNRLGLPVYGTSDGPHGVKYLRFQENGMPEPFGDVTCFPTACAMANSWNRDMVRHMGELLGEEAQLEGTGVSLGPAVNIKRHPLCGRNFEYYSEDPFLAGELGTAAVKGIQSQGTPASLKHFAANNQEYRRTSIDEIIDERTFRELYLPAFEKIVKDAKPATVMCAYNKINGEFSSSNRRLLTEILREEWGFDGVVMSDWGAVHDRVASIHAGLDLEMPGPGHFDNQIRKALDSGELTVDEIEICAQRIVELILRIQRDKKPAGKINHPAHHEQARRMAGECMVLLKNTAQTLPLTCGRKVTVIGGLAEDIRYQGGGSSMVMNQEVDQPLDEIRQFADVAYAPGYHVFDAKREEALEKEAIELARQGNPIIYFMGLTYGYESEDYDRYDMNLPQNQIDLLDMLYQENTNIIVVLNAGSAVEMNWEDKCKAIIYASLAGEGCGRAIANILFGKTNPSGKLSETFPLCLEHTPAYLNYPGTDGKVHYAEGLYVGYRYYEKKKLPVRYAFGYGISYTDFQYSDLKISKSHVREGEPVIVSCNITNTGDVAGKEIVQLYIRDVLSTVDRPYKELKGFEKVTLAPGERKTVTFELDARSFAYYDTRINDWHVETGEFELMIAAASDDVRLTDRITVESAKKIPNKYTENTLFYELKNDVNAYQYMKQITEQMPAANLPGYDHQVGPMGMDKIKQRKGMTLRNIALGDGANDAFLSTEQLAEILDKMNNEQ